MNGPRQEVSSVTASACHSASRFQVRPAAWSGLHPLHGTHQGHAVLKTSKTLLGDYRALGNNLSAEEPEESGPMSEAGFEMC